MATDPISGACAGCGERGLPARALFCFACGTPVAPVAVQPVATADTISARPTAPESPAARARTDDVPATIRASDPPSGASRQTASSSADGVSGGADDEAHDPLVGETIVGRFRVTRRLGAGGMGTVYLAEQLAMRRQVVLKFLHARMSSDAEMTKRFEREALAVSQLSCPNTVIIHDYGQASDGRFFMAMEYLAGQSLGQLLRRAGAIAPLRTIAIVLQVLESLAEAHEKGMVHRDLKPDNIMLIERGGTVDVVKVLDFGIVKMLDREGVDPQGPAHADGAAAARAASAKARAAAIAVDELTREGDVFGSPRYMAPEQIVGEAVDARADIYAIGVILFEMLSGEPPFSADSLLGLFNQQTTGKMPKLRVGDIPEPALEALVQSCLSRTRENRPAGAAQLAETLRALVPRLIERQKQDERRLLELAGVRRRWPRLLAPVIGLGVAVVALALLLLLRAGTSEPAGHALAPGERVFVSAAAPRVPRWIDTLSARNNGTLGVVRDLARRSDAQILASAAAVGRLVDVPARFDPKRQRAPYLADLSKIYERLVMLDAPLRPTLRTYWVKLRGAERATYDGYALAERPADLAPMRRAFATMRYRRFNLLLDDAVRRRECNAAGRLADKIRGAIADLALEPKRDKQLRFHLGRALAGCQRDSKSPQ